MWFTRELLNTQTTSFSFQARVFSVFASTRKACGSEGVTGSLSLSLSHHLYDADLGSEGKINYETYFVNEYTHDSRQILLLLILSL